MSDRPDIPPEGVEAGEYVLGLMSDTERLAFEARLADDADLRAEVLEWERYFAAMAEAEVAEIAPPARVEAAIKARLFEAGGTSIWHRVGVWRALALAATIAIAALFFWPASQEPGPAYEARIASEDGALVLTAVLEGDLLRIARLSGGVAEGRSQELWLIAGDAAPISLGLVPDAAAAALAVPEDLRALFAGGVLAITDEPPGGSPEGIATGAVLALGSISDA